MIVTDRDCVIADYAIRSYAKIRSVPFRLIIYSNWVRSDLRARYFARWREWPYVEVWEDPAQTDDRKPQDRRTLWGPFELGYRVWDRELKKLGNVPYHATVDPDFEILDPGFVDVMLDRLSSEPRLVAMSTDYSPRIPETYDTFSRRTICLNERWHTWFVIYKREALRCGVSHAYRDEYDPVLGRVSAWDDAAFFQKALREEHGFELAALGPEHRRCFIHYGGFGQNRHVDERNVVLYRRLRILAHRGLFGAGDPVTRLGARALTALAFRDSERASYAPGWMGGSA